MSSLEPKRPCRRSSAFLLGLALTLSAVTAKAQSASDTNPSSNPISPPKLLHFEPAEYPEAAKFSGLEANVLLKLDIDAEGQVTQVQVVQAAGHGFDEAASAAAQRFAFTPAQRGDTPVASRILYKYAFKLSPLPPEPKEAMPKFGLLKGTLLGGDPPMPLAGVEVHLRPSNAPEVSVVTDAEGGFQWPELSDGEVAIDATLTGFEPLHVKERVTGGQATVVKYTLVSTEQDAWEVTVRGAAVHREVTHYELNRQELLRVPGTFGDAMHAVEAMPSVARPPAFSGALIVRGSAPQDTQVFVEGTLVPQVFHYGSLSSVVPSEMIEKLDFYPGNFSVRYGRGMGGIVEVGLRETNPDGKYHGSAQMDFINVRANAEGPIPYSHGWNFMAGARMSYVDRWLVPVLRSSGSAIKGMPRYSDYQMYLERKLPKDGVFRVGFFGAQDKYVPIEENPKDWTPPTDSFGYVQSLLRLPLSPDVNFRASWSMGRMHSTAADEDGRMTVTTANLATGRAEISAKTGSIGIARVGTDVMYAPFTVGAVTDVQQSGGGLASTQTDSPSLRSLDLHGVVFQAGYLRRIRIRPQRANQHYLGRSPGLCQGHA